MSFLRKLFGGSSAEEERADGERLIHEGAYGQAKLAFERALERTSATDEAARKEMMDRIDHCRDAIANQRLGLAEEYVDSGQPELARIEIESALDVAADPAIIEQANLLVDRMEQHQAVKAAVPEVELTDEDRLAILAGGWEEAQADEYEEYGEAFDRALLQLQDERATDALALLDEVLSKAEEPRYLQLERAKALLLLDRESEAKDALESFLSALVPGEGGDARLAAHVHVARIADEAGDFEGALAAYQAAIDELDDDPRPYLAMGNYLRLKGMPDEALEVLEVSASLMSELRPDWTILYELALAQAATGKRDAAIETLESIIEIYSSRGDTNYPPAAALELAKLCEEAGRLQRAADLFRTLTLGRDRANHALYHREAGRLLIELGMEMDARRMLKRALALTGENQELRATISALLDKIGGDS